MAKSKGPKLARAVMKLEDLYPAGWNPRTISDEAKAGLRHSIARFGLVQPLVWNKKSKHLVGGHQRYAVLLDDYGPKHEVEVVVVNLSKAKERELNITLNNPAIQGDFTDDLDSLLDELQAADAEAYEDLLLEQVRIYEPELPKGDDPVTPPKIKKTYTCPHCGETFKAN